LNVRIHWSGFASGSNQMNWDVGAGGVNYYFGAVGPMPVVTKNNQGGILDQIWVTATDRAGKTSRLNGTKITVLACTIPTIN
jgi:hypothetical protein